MSILLAINRHTGLSSETTRIPPGAQKVLRTLLYTSESLLSLPRDAELLNTIVEPARLHNQMLDVTGALLCTETHFVQVLEGPARSIEAVMERIRADNRHHGLNVLLDHSLKARAFASWTLVFAGRSAFVMRRVNSFISLSQSGSPRGRHMAAQGLIRLMTEFAASGITPKIVEAKGSAET